MNETNNKTCQFKIDWLAIYECSEPVLGSSEKRYCIFHEPRKDKDIKKFQEGIKEKIGREDYDFTGYWFPEHTAYLFSGHNFKNDASFQKATFEGEVDFAGSIFKGNAWFSRCTFGGNIFFSGSTFEKEADFRGSKLGSKFETTVVEFSEATFKRETASFTGAIFEGRAQFIETTFEDRADFSQARFKLSPCLEKLKIKGFLVLEGTKFEELQGADVPFRIGKMLWHRAGNYVKEGEYHYLEMDYIRKQKK